MADRPLRLRDDHGIVVIEFDHGANALDAILVAALTTCLDELRGSGAPPVLLASGHPTLFSPGWDLKRLVWAARPELAAFLRDFERLILTLFSYPGPTGAAINGHAVAGGCLLALACDHRTMSEGGARAGLSEVNLGVPVPRGCVRMVTARLDAHAVQALVLAGEGATAARAVELGVAHRTAAPERVHEVALHELGALAAKPPSAYAAAKRFMHGDAWAAMAIRDETAETTFLDAWFAADTQDRLRAMVQRLGD